MDGDTNIISEPSKKTPAKPPGTKDATIVELMARIEKLEQEAKDKDAKISELKEHVISVETELPSMMNKKRKFSNSKQDTDEEDVMKQLQNENEQLKKRIEVLEALQQNTTNPTNSQENASTSNTTTQSPEDIMTMIKRELSSGFSEIKENVNQLIDTKLNKLPTVTNDTIPSNPTDLPTISYASAVGNNHVKGNLRSIMMTRKNEEITEQNEKNEEQKYHCFRQEGAQPTISERRG